MTTLFKYYNENHKPTKESILVFGSNLLGIHQDEVPRTAMDEFNARFGIGLGLTGDSFGIPVKDQNFKRYRLSVVKQFVRIFNEYTWFKPNCKFFVTRVGCDHDEHSDEVMAPLFEHCNPRNCEFPYIWKQFLENNT